MAENDTATSPRLAALGAELAAGNTAALAAFWDEVAAAGAPLIEPLPDDPRQVLVTFLWRAEKPVENVVVVGGPAGFDFMQNQMARLGETDLWYKSMPVRRDTRTLYQLVPNDPLTPLAAAPDLRARMAGFLTDPFNPRTYLYPKDDEDLEDREVYMSILELPDAAPQPWVAARPDAPAGQVTMHRLRSERLDNERRVWVYTPPGYNPEGAPYGLLLLFDGLAYILLVPTPTILDNLINAGTIPSLVAVLPDSLNQETRNRELPCYPPFVDFLTEELLPWVRDRYHITSDPAQSVVAGSSYGGLAATFVGLRRSDLFGNVLSQSGAFWWHPEGEDEPEWLARQFVDSPRLPLRFYLDVGLLETGSSRDNGPSQLITNRHMRDVLRAKGYPIHYAEYSGRHEYLWWQGTLADGLLFLLGGTA